MFYYQYKYKLVKKCKNNLSDFKNTEKIPHTCSYFCAFSYQQAASKEEARSIGNSRRDAFLHLLFLPFSVPKIMKCHEIIILFRRNVRFSPFYCIFNEVLGAFEDSADVRLLYHALNFARSPCLE